MGITIKGIDLKNLEELGEMLRMLDADFYINSLLPNLPKDDATHYSDIRVVSLDWDADEIHLSNRVGWVIESGVGEEWASLDRIYEAKVSLKLLLDETVPSNERVRLVNWRESEVQRVAKENEVSEDGKSSISTVTTTWNRVEDKSNRLEDVVKAVDVINSIRNKKYPHVEKCRGCDDEDVERLMRHLNKDM